MITLILLIPVIGSIIILLQSHVLPSIPFLKKINNSILQREEMAQPIAYLQDEKNNDLKIKKIALTTSLINLFISLILWYQFDSNITQFQFVSEFNQLNYFHLNFGIDGLSIYFVLLTTFITPIALLSNYSNITNNLRFFLVSILMLESLQICAFVSLDLLLFYIFFESVLPLLFIIILIFGHGEDRFRSAFLFFLYTLAGSLPMLLSILMIFNFVGSTDFQLIPNISLEYQKILFIGFFIAFAVKTPLYPFIIWLPKAHADSPLAGSVILAATILKLATYGALWTGTSHIGALKLSNSGDTLKLIIPNYIWKSICGWSNHSGRVINYKMTENEMGYRGSKSEITEITTVRTNTVKEQRVDGSWSNRLNYSPMLLRYTLMGCESNYQVNIPSKQIIIQTRNFCFDSRQHLQCKKYKPSSAFPDLHKATTVMDSSNKLDPWFVTGFTDAEGCFGLYIFKNTNYKTDWSVSLVFQISLHERDRNILEQIKNYFGVGGIFNHDSASLNYSVRSYKDLQIIIAHFDKFPLISQKLKDYTLFKLAYNLFIKKEHLSIEGVEKLVVIKNSMNLGLSPQLKAAFANINPNKEIEEPYLENTNTGIKKITEPNWVAGFASGEGCFLVDLIKSKSTKIGFSISLRFIITQHSRDEQLLLSLIHYFNCGKLNKNNNCFNLTIRKFEDLDKKIIPFFIKYPIVGQKLLDFRRRRLCRVGELINKKAHLTIEGLNIISEIKSKMNTRRV